MRTRIKRKIKRAYVLVQRKAMFPGAPSALPVFCSPHPLSAVFANYLQYRARPSSGVTRKIAPPETPAVPASPSRTPFQVPPSVPSGPEDGRTGRLGTLARKSECGKASAGTNMRRLAEPRLRNKATSREMHMVIWENQGGTERS